MMRTRRQAKLKEVYREPKRPMHDPIPEPGLYLRSVVGGHIRYYAVPMNTPSVSGFPKEAAQVPFSLFLPPLSCFSLRAPATE